MLLKIKFYRTGPADRDSNQSPKGQGKERVMEKEWNLKCSCGEPATTVLIRQWGREYTVPIDDGRWDRKGFQGNAWPLCQVCLAEEILQQEGGELHTLAEWERIKGGSTIRPVELTGECGICGGIFQYGRGSEEWARELPTQHFWCCGSKWPISTINDIDS